MIMPVIRKARRTGPNAIATGLAHSAGASDFAHGHIWQAWYISRTNQGDAPHRSSPECSFRADRAR